MRVLVTGANGFLGRYVASNARRAGHVVIGIGHGDWAAGGEPSVDLDGWAELDVTLGNLLSVDAAPDLIVHCAGSGSVGFSFDHSAQDFERTALSTLAVLEYVRVAGLRAPVVYPSSAAVYGMARHLPTQVTEATQPVSPYGVHKLIAEQLINSYGRFHGVCSSIVRVFSAYGPGLRKQLMWDACEKWRNGLTEFSGTGSETRDWVHADDIARLLLLAGEHASPSAPVVHAASGVETTLSDVLRTLFDGLDGGRSQPTFSGVSRPGDPTRYLGANESARALGWQPMVPVSSGIEQYAHWYRSVRS